MTALKYRQKTNVKLAKVKRKLMAQAQEADLQEGDAQNSNVSFHHHLPQLQHNLQNSSLHDQNVNVSLDPVTQATTRVFNTSLEPTIPGRSSHNVNKEIPVHSPSAPPHHIIHHPQLHHSTAQTQARHVQSPGKISNYQDSEEVDVSVETMSELKKRWKSEIDSLKILFIIVISSV